MVQEKFVALGVPVFFDGQKVTYFLQRREDFWEFPGGKIELGETPLNAMIRELKEEVDLDVLPQDSKLIRYFTRNFGEKVYHFFVFLVRLQGQLVRTEGHMLDFSSIKNHKMWEANQVILEDLALWQNDMQAFDDWKFFWKQVQSLC
jgi:mutator protein MutT